MSWLKVGRLSRSRISGEGYTGCPGLRRIESEPEIVHAELTNYFDDLIFTIDSDTGRVLAPNDALLAPAEEVSARH